MGDVLGLVLAAALVVTPVPRPADIGPLVYSDTFDSWTGDWSTREDMFTGLSSCAKADPKCARVVNGEMVLSVRPDPENPGKWLTGHVGTMGRREFTYGYYETKAMFPPIRGVLSAFWLQTTEDYIVGQAEIDVAECTGRSAVWHNVYWRLAGMGPGEFAPPVKILTDLGGPGAQAQWHVYGVDWRPDRYDFYVDGQLVASTTQGLSDRPKFLALSIKLPDYMLPLFDPDQRRAYKARFKYVRVWQ